MMGKTHHYLFIIKNFLVSDLLKTPGSFFITAAAFTKFGRHLTKSLQMTSIVPISKERGQRKVMVAQLFLAEPKISHIM